MFSSEFDCSDVFARPRGNRGLKSRGRLASVDDWYCATGLPACQWSVRNAERFDFRWNGCTMAEETVCPESSPRKTPCLPCAVKDDGHANSHNRGLELRRLTQWRRLWTTWETWFST